MKQSDVIKLLGMLTTAYPNMKGMEGSTLNMTVDIWYECLQDIDKDVAIVAIKKNIMESSFPPTIADIRKQVTEIMTMESERLDGASAWGEVLKAIRRDGSYNEVKALESMSSTTRQVVKYMGWKELCFSENTGVIRGQFLRMYDTVANRERTERLLPIAFREDIKQISEGKKKIDSLVEELAILGGKKWKERKGINI